MPAKPKSKSRATAKRQPAGKPASSPARTRTASAKPASGKPELARLTAAQQKEYEHWSNAGFTARKNEGKLKALAGGPALKQYTVVAEGDSWFDYKPAFLGGKDLLGHLQTSGRINVFRVGKAGDTLENMVYGTATTGDGPGMAPKFPPQIEQTLAAIRDKNPDAFFFSGGGNDLAGVELAGFLNHKESGMKTIRQDSLSFVLGEYFEKALAVLIKKVRLVKAGLPVFLHGYDYAIPDGRDVGFLGFSFAGPWLKPALTQKRYSGLTEGLQIMRTMLDQLNNALIRVAKAHTGVHFIELRGTLRTGANYKKDWANELHPTSSGFKLLASVIEQQVLKVLGGS